MSNLESVDEAIARTLADPAPETPDSGGSAGNGRRYKQSAETRRRKSEASKAAAAARKARGERVGRPPKSEEQASSAPPPVTEDDVRAYALLGGTVWNLAGKMIGLRALTPEEALQLGGAMAPVGAKWMPFMSRWAPELNLVVTVVALYQATKVHVEPEPEPEPMEAAA